MKPPRLFKKRSKKALSHVDWAMSLAVFLLYLAWFFILVKPVFDPSQNLDVLLDVLEDGVEDYVQQDVERVQVYVPGDFENEYEPIMIPFDYGWDTSDIALTADYFVVDEGKMFFLGNLSETDRFMIYYPHDALVSRPVSAVFADEDSARSGSFTANFDDYLVESVYFMGEERLSDFAVEVDGTEIDDEGIFEESTLLAKYKRTGDYINLSSYVFAENSILQSYISSVDHRNHSVQVDIAVYNYTYFYFDPVDKGDVDYGISPSCRYYNGDFLDLYDSSSGLLITFGRNITFRLCSNETNVLVRLEFDISAGDEDELVMMFHEGGVDSVLDYPVRPIVGVTEVLNTISSSKVAMLNNRNYDYLKQLFNYPDARDFNVTITSDVVSATCGTAQPLVEDVYARNLEGFVLDDSYGQERVNMVLTVW